MQKKNRPLSPHLVIYKPQITSIVSIFHRISGSIIAMGLIILVFIIYLDIINSEYYIIYFVSFNFLYVSLFIIILNFMLLTFCFHFCNGIRHLCWDFCFGLDIKKVYVTGLVVLISTLAALFIILL
jgi:succinate dehydrogenase / fumarate reductase cytochrome b subunit